MEERPSVLHTNEVIDEEQEVASAVASNNEVNGVETETNKMYGYHTTPPRGLPMPPQNGFGQQPPRSKSRQISTSTEITLTSDENFAVRSIRRGTKEWKELVKPFVSDLAFCSVVSQPFHRQNGNNGLLFRPFTCPEAVIMFVDISGYSKIAAALADRGAHALSTAVNSYLSRILQIVQQQFGGDIVKFAGDAVLCVWYDSNGAGGEGSNHCSKSHSLEDALSASPSADVKLSSLQKNVLAATLCATELQSQAGHHQVAGTGHEFRIHIGLCQGTIESEVFVAPVHYSMQRMYHLVGGEGLEEIGDLVDYAKAGEICVSPKLVRLLGTVPNVTAQYAPLHEEDFCFDSEDDCAELLVDLAVPSDLRDEIEHFVDETMVDRMTLRNRSMEEEFIHPAILDLLSHGGLSPTQIAQMRDLVVLFIAQTSHGSPANWLLEVQAILDRNQCPLLQVVADDKGVHAIAAVNAVASIPESRLLGLEICRQLEAQQIGVAIGMAAGVTFCGVTGSSATACRWDITGGPAVRAARLMQYALRKNVPMAIDESLYVGSTVPARMTLLEEDVPLKGSEHPIRVFTLSEATEFAAMNLLETVHGDMHVEEVEKIKTHITGTRRRCAVVVTGPTLSGKKIVCQQAAGFASMVPFLHVADSSYGMLQLARTVAKWFKYVAEESVRMKAKHVLTLMDQGLLSRAHDECLALVDEAVECGLVACFVVDRVEFLDDFSISLIRECLHGRKYRTHESSSNGKDPLRSLSSSMRDSISMDSFSSGNQGGRIAFLCVHIPFYGCPSARSVADDITRSHRSLCVPIVEILEASSDQFKKFFTSMSGVRLDDRLLYAASASAGYCAGYFVERSAAIGEMQPARLLKGQTPLLVMTDNMTYTVPPGLLREYRSLSVMQVGSEIAMRYAHVYDELPPIMQVVCKVLAVVSETAYFWAPRQRIWEVLNDLIADGVSSDTMEILLSEMTKLYLIRLWIDDGDGVEYVKFQSPALAHIALDVCTPDQLEHIASAWIGRLGPERRSQFRVPFVLAWLSLMTDPHKQCTRRAARASKLWKEGYRQMIKQSLAQSWPKSKLNRWKELIASEIEAGGCSVEEVLGEKFDFGMVMPKSLDIKLMQVFMYRGPIGLGPLGETLSIMAQQIMDDLVACADGGTKCEPRTNMHMLSAVRRCKADTKIVEKLLGDYGLSVESVVLASEEKVLDKMTLPVLSKDELLSKAVEFTDCLIGKHMESRVSRLRKLSEVLDKKEIPKFVAESSSDALRMAYQIMFQEWACSTQASAVDNAQHALMILATRGWQPRDPPEPIRHLARQSVARLRNAVVRKLSFGQLHFARHQQSAVDLKAFLLSTTLLWDVQDQFEVSC